MSIGSAGAAGRQNVSASNAAVFANSWNPNELIDQAMKARSLEKQTAFAADAAVRQTEEAAEAKIGVAEKKADMFETKMNLRKDLRKAGLVAAAGSLAATGLMKQPERKPTDFSATEAYIQKYGDRTKSLRDRMSTLEADGPNYPNKADYTLPPFPTFGDDGKLTTPDPAKGIVAPAVGAEAPSSVGSGGWKGMSKVISYAEGTSGPKGYNTQFTGTQFTNMGDHPRQLRSGGGYTSDAAGKYQFLSTTWDPIKQKLNLPDFGPDSQEKAGRYLVQEKGLNPDAVYRTKDEFRSAMDKVAPVWAGLPYSGVSPKGFGKGSSFYGQGGKTVDELWPIYAESMGIQS